MYGFSAILCLVILVVPGWTSGKNEILSYYSKSIGNCTSNYRSTPVKCCENSAEGKAPEMHSKLVIINRSSFAMCCGDPLQSEVDNNASVADPLPCSSENTDGQFSASRKYHHTKADTLVVKRASLAFELESCQGEDVILFCNVTRGHKLQVSWRKEGRDAILSTSRYLSLQNVQRESSGLYFCEMIDPLKSIIRKRIRLTVQFSPIITVPKIADDNSSANEERQFLCNSESNPPAQITWLRNGVPVNESENSRYVVVTEVKNCVTMSVLRVQGFDNSTSNRILDASYTCQAKNSHGQANFTHNHLPVLPGSEGSAEEKRKFNVSGFIIGMLPPLFISFYIILKLGYRSRYAEERGEDDGVREEPFFISY